jgi:hypothetical protein
VTKTGNVFKKDNGEKTWTKRTLSIIVVVAVAYGIWFNLIDSLAYCIPQSGVNNQFRHTCTSIGTIFGGNSLYQMWNIIGHCLPGLFMALLFKKKKLELFVAGVLISTVVMDSPLWGVERKFFHGLPLWTGVNTPGNTPSCNQTHIIEWRIANWILYYYNPTGSYLVWDTNWLFPCFPNAAAIFWSITGRVGAVVLLLWYQNKIESKNEDFSLKKLLFSKRFERGGSRI